MVKDLKTTAVFYELIVSGICVIAAGDKRKLKKLEKHFTQIQGMLYEPKCVDTFLYY